MPVAWEEYEPEVSWQDFQPEESGVPTVVAEPETPIRQIPDWMKGGGTRTLFTVPGTAGAVRMPVPPSEAVAEAKRTGLVTQPAIALPSAEIKPEDSFAKAVGYESYNVLKSVPEFFTSPLGATTLMTGGLSRLGQAIIKLGFTADMAKQLGETVLSTYREWDKMTNAQKGKALVDLAGTGTLGFLLGKSFVKDVPMLGKRGRAIDALSEELANANVSPELPTPTPERRLGIGPVPTTPFEQPGIVELADAALRERQQLVRPAGEQGQPALGALRIAVGGGEPRIVTPELPAAPAVRIPGGGEAPYGKVSYMRQMQESIAKAGEVLPVAAAEAEKGVTDATKERNVQESVLGERPGDDAQRAPAEAGVGGGVRPTAPVTPQEVPRPESEQGGILLKPDPIVAAAFRKNGKIFDARTEGGVTHMEADMAAEAAGVHVEEKDAGFITASGRFLTREEAYEHAKGTQQLIQDLDTFEQGKLHTGKMPSYETELPLGEQGTAPLVTEDRPSQGVIFRGEGGNLGWSAVPAQWWTEDLGVARRFGSEVVGHIKPEAKVLRLTNPPGSDAYFNEAGWAELQRIADKYGIKIKELKELGGGESLFDPNINKGLLDAVKKEGYQVIHADFIEGHGSLVLDANAIRRIERPKNIARIIQVSSGEFIVQNDIGDNIHRGAKSKQEAKSWMKNHGLVDESDFIAKATNTAKTEPPPPVTEAAPQTTAPTGAAPEGEPVVPVSAGTPPGILKGDISPPKEQAPAKRGRKLLPVEQAFLDTHGITIKEAIDSGLIRQNKAFKKDGTEKVVGYSPASADSWEFTNALEAANKEKELRAKASAEKDPDRDLRERIWDSMTSEQRRAVRQNPRVAEKPEGVLDWEFLSPYAKNVGAEPKQVSRSPVEKDTFTLAAPTPKELPVAARPMAETPQQLVEYRVPATGKIKRFIKWNNQWFRSEGGVTKGKPLDPEIALTRALEKQLAGEQAVKKAASEGQTLVAGTDLEKWANEQLKGGGTHLGPDVLAAYLVKGVGLMERGVIKFADWAQRMIAEHGDSIRPHLQQLFNEAKSVFERRAASPTFNTAKNLFEQQRLSTAGATATAGAGKGPAPPPGLGTQPLTPPTQPVLGTPPSATPNIVSRAVTGLRKAASYFNLTPIPNLEKAKLGDAAYAHASARNSVIHSVRDYLSRVFPTQYKDPVAMAKTMDIAVKDNILGGYDDALADLAKATTPQAKAAIQKRIAEIQDANDLAGMDRDVRAALRDPDISANLRRWREIINPEMDTLYNEMRGVDPNTPRESRGRHFGARINLLPQFHAEEMGTWGDQSKPMPTTSVSNYRNPNVKRDPFSKRAKLTGDYSTDAMLTLINSFGHRWNEVTKLRFYKAITDSGNGVITDTGVRGPQEIGGQRARRMPIKVNETGKDGKVKPVEKSLWVREDLVHEIRNVLDTDMRAPDNPIFKVLTGIQLAQLADMTSHMKNIHTVVTSALGASKGWQDAIRKFPGLGTVDTVGRIGSVAMEIARDTPEIRQEIATMAKQGLIRPKYPSTGIQKITRGQELIHDVDTASRVAMNRFFDNLVERGMAVDSIANRRKFVQAIGEYNRRLMPQLMRTARDYGVSPFVVAGTTFNRFARRQLGGSYGFEAASGFRTQTVSTPSGGTTTISVRDTISPAAKARATQLSGLVTAAMVPAVINYFTTGNFGGREGTPIGAIDTGTDNDKGDHRIIDVFHLLGFRRGLRGTGVGAVIEGAREGQSIGRIGGKAIEDITSTLSHPFLGPGPTALYSTLSGKRLDLRGGASPYMARNVGGGLKQYAENARVTLKNQNALLYGLASPLLGEPEESYGESLKKGLFKSPLGAVGYQEPARTDPVSRAHDMARNWMEKSSDPYLQEKAKTMAGIERGQAPDPEYATLRHALRTGNMEKAKKEYEHLLAQRPSSENRYQRATAVAQAMRPFTVGRKVPGTDYRPEIPKPFTGRKDTEAQFVATLTSEQKKVYQQSFQERMKTYKLFQQMLSNY